MFPWPVCIDETVRVRAVDVELSVRLTGDPEGDVVIATPGGPGASGDYLGVVWEGVPEGMLLVTYDPRTVGRSMALRGLDPPAGASPAPSSDDDDTVWMGLDAWASDIEAIRRHLGRDEVHVLGHSWGGVTAMAYATTHVDHVRSLVLVSPAGATRRSTFAVGPAVRARLESLDQPPPPADLPESCADRWPYFVAYYADPSRIRTSHLPTACDDEVFERTYEDAAKWDLRPDLPSLNLPILLYYGDPDPVDVTGTILRRHLPLHWVTDVVLSDCGHRPMFECPDAFFPVLRSFLDDSR